MVSENACQAKIKKLTEPENTVICNTTCDPKLFGEFLVNGRIKSR
jgi:hypothetical protein